MKITLLGLKSFILVYSPRVSVKYVYFIDQEWHHVMKQTESKCIRIGTFRTAEGSNYLNEPILFILNLGQFHILSAIVSSNPFSQNREESLISRH